MKIADAKWSDLVIPDRSLDASRTSNEAVLMGVTFAGTEHALLASVVYQAGHHVIRSF
jgi:hypothetical protein